MSSDGGGSVDSLFPSRTRAVARPSDIQRASWIWSTNHPCSGTTATYAVLHRAGRRPRPYRRGDRTPDRNPGSRNNPGTLLMSLDQRADSLRFLLRDPRREVHHRLRHGLHCRGYRRAPHHHKPRQRTPVRSGGSARYGASAPTECSSSANGTWRAF